MSFIFFYFLLILNTLDKVDRYILVKKRYCKRFLWCYNLIVFSGGTLNKNIIVMQENALRKKHKNPRKVISANYCIMAFYIKPRKD